MLRKRPQAQNFARTIRTRSDSGSFQRYVKSLFIDGCETTSEDASLVLSTCTGVERLVLRSLGRKYDFSMTNLRYLTLAGNAVDAQYYLHNLPPTLTHLALDSNMFSWFPLSGILDLWEDVFARCPALTHVCWAVLSYPADFDLISAIVSILPPTLEMLAIQIWAVHDEEQARSLGQDLKGIDGRVVFVSYDLEGRPGIPIDGVGLRHFDTKDGWGYLWREREDEYIWRFAQEAVEKRRGEISYPKF